MQATQLPEESGMACKFIPGMRICGQPWNVSVIQEYVPYLCTKEVTIEDMVRRMYGSSCCQYNWLRYYVKFVTPCPKCVNDVKLPLSFLDPDSAPTCLLSHEKNLAARGLLDGLVAGEDIFEQHHLRHLAIAQMSKTRIWRIETMESGDLLIRVGSGTWMRRRGQEGDAMKSCEELATASRMLLDDKPRVQLRYYQGAIGVAYFSYASHFNRHGVASIISPMNCDTPEYPYFDYASSYSFLSDDAASTHGRAQEEILRHSILTFYRWMNAENVQFLRDVTYSTCNPTSNFLTVRKVDSSIGMMYTLYCPFTGKVSNYYDDL